MDPSFLKIRIPTELYKRYRILCIKKNLSLQNQTVSIIKSFVTIQEEYDNKVSAANEINKK